VVEHRTTIPILSSILVEAEENRLRMVATDLDMTIVTECPATILGGGRATLESKVFQNLVRSLPEEEFTLRQDGDAVEIECGRFHSRMAVSDRLCAAIGSLPTDVGPRGICYHEG